MWHMGWDNRGAILWNIWIRRDVRSCLNGLVRQARRMLILRVSKNQDVPKDISVVCHLMTQPSAANLTIGHVAVKDRSSVHGSGLQPEMSDRRMDPAHAA